MKKKAINEQKFNVPGCKKNSEDKQLDQGMES
jgi:hypothetical protein